MGESDAPTALSLCLKAPPHPVCPVLPRLGLQIQELSYWQLVGAPLERKYVGNGRGGLELPTAISELWDKAKSRQSQVKMPPEPQCSHLQGRIMFLCSHKPSHLLGPVGSPNRSWPCCSWWGRGGEGPWLQARRVPPPCHCPTPQGNQTCPTQRQPWRLHTDGGPESDPTPPRQSMGYRTSFQRNLP